MYLYIYQHTILKLINIQVYNKYVTSMYNAFGIVWVRSRGDLITY